MSTFLTTDDTQDDEGLPIWKPGEPVSHIYLYDATRDLTMLGTIADLKALLAPGAPLPIPAAPTFTNFQDTQAGGSVVLVPAPGTVAADYLYRVGASGPDQSVPTNGVIVVGNIAGSVYAYLPASGTHAQGATATSDPFTSYTAPLPTPVITFQALANQTVGGFPFPLLATSTNSATPITFSSSAPTKVEVRLDPGGWVGEPLAAAASVVITASQAAGNGFGPATATRTVTVTATTTTPVITFNPLPDALFGDQPSELSATSTNTVTPITYASSNPAVVTVAQNGSVWRRTIVGPGTATITASQVTGNGFGPGSTSRTQLVEGVKPAAPTIVSVTPGNNTIRIVVQAPGNTGGLPISNLSIFLKDGTQALYSGSSSGTTVTYDYSGALNGTAYQFEASATNSKGEGPRSAASAAVTPSNQLPTGSAGTNATITQPAASVQLSGSAADSDGTVVTTIWNFVSGPATPTITNGNTLTPTASGLTTVGAYVFRLTITDNNQGTKVSDVTITVAAAAVVTPTYSETLSNSKPEGSAVYFVADSTEQINFQGLDAGAPGFICEIVRAGKTCVASLPGEYKNQPFFFQLPNGTWVDKDASGNPLLFIEGTINL